MNEQRPADHAPNGVIAARPVRLDYTPPAGKASPLSLPRIAQADAALDLALIVTVLLVLRMGLELIPPLLFPEAAETAPRVHGPGFYAAITAVKCVDALMAIGAAALFLYRHRPKLSTASFGLQLDHFGRQVLWSLPTLAAVYAAFISTVIVVTLAVSLLPSLEEDVLERTEFFELLPLENIVASILLLIPVAIHEELLFRGLLIPYLRRVGCPWAVAILLSSAVFASLHFQQGWIAVVQIFFVGLALAVFFVASRSLLAVILAHFAFDLIQFQVVRFLLPTLQKWAETSAELLPV